MSCLQQVSAPDAPLVSVIIVNCNRRDLLLECLGSLRGQYYQPFEVIVVDNGSTDDSITLLKHFPLSPIQLIENKVNVGFSAANNQALARCRGSYVALLNNDAIADPGWLAELVKALEDRPTFGMAASKVLAYDAPNVIDKSGHLIYLDGQNRGRGSGEIDRGQYDRFEEVAWPDGCAAFYRRSLFEQIGGFDEDFFAYADDAELGLRARIAGWRCLSVPTAVVRHRLGATLGRHSEQRLFLIERNRIWLAVKLFPLRLLILNPFYTAARLLATAAAWAGGRGEISRAVSSTSPTRLLQCLVRAHWAALRGLPTMLRKRRDTRGRRVLSASETARMIRRFRIPLADLVGKAR